MRKVVKDEQAPASSVTVDFPGVSNTSEFMGQWTTVIHWTDEWVVEEGEMGCPSMDVSHRFPV